MDVKREVEDELVEDELMEDELMEDEVRVKLVNDVVVVFLVQVR